MEYTTYLFDFDYTLVDSSRGIVLCFRNVLERHEHTDITDEQIKRTIGKTLEESFSILTGIEDTNTLAQYRKEYVKEADEHVNANTVLFPETIHVLQELKAQGAKIGIVSTKYRYRIEELVEKYFPKGFFDIIIGGEDVKEMKPSPQGILKALKKLRRNRKETLYIGDSTVDAQAAFHAKVDFVGVLNGMTTREELESYPHRRILENLSLLPLVQHSSAYKPCKFLPYKVEAIYRFNTNQTDTRKTNGGSYPTGCFHLQELWRGICGQLLFTLWSNTGYSSFFHPQCVSEYLERFFQY